ncbi:hypothetical protein GCM10020331_007820 [Ectobacillus funiculus]
MQKKILGDESKVELKEVTSKNAYTNAEKNGDIDMIIATMTITEERKQEVDFSDVYFKAGQALLVKKGSNIKGIDDIKKRHNGSCGKRFYICRKHPSKKAPEATVLEFENYSEAFQALKSWARRRIDYR